MSNRVYNFCPGPCTLPLEVLEEAQSELVNYQDSGMSIVECSHRGTHYDQVHNEVVGLVKELLEVPDDFSVLLIQGGATLQFTMTAMNLLSPSDKAGFVNSGHWAKLAIKDAKMFANTYQAWDNADEKYTRSPQSYEIEIETDTKYLHVTTNETIGGVQMQEWPDLGVPLVCDMSSDYFSRPIPWNLVDVAYGGAQKNIGPSGVAVVIVRNSVIEKSPRELPSYLDYRVHQKSNSLFNTPAVFSVFVAGKVLKWYKSQGGIPHFKQLAADKSATIYDVIDSSDGFYSCPVQLQSRSHMNVVFNLPSEGLESKFLADAQMEGLVNLKGHRSVGGIRASIYNAMPVAGVDKLAAFMSNFRNSHS